MTFNDDKYLKYTYVKVSIPCVTRTHRSALLEFFTPGHPLVRQHKRNKRKKVVNTVYKPWWKKVLIDMQATVTRRSFLKPCKCCMDEVIDVQVGGEKRYIQDVVAPACIYNAAKTLKVDEGSATVFLTDEEWGACHRYEVP